MRNILKTFLAELSRRNIYKVVVAYGLFAYTFAHIGYICTNSFNTSDQIMKTVILMLTITFPPIIIFQWFYVWTEKGFRRRASENYKTLKTCVYTDIAGSTQLALKLGNVYSDIIKEHRILINDIARKYHGKVIEYIGDCTFIIFDSVIDAVVCSSLIIKGFESEYWKDKLGFSIKIGINTGWFSSANTHISEIGVIKASMLTRIAQAGKVYLTQETFEKSPETLPSGLSYINHGLYNFKGLQLEQNLYELVIAGIYSSSEAIPVTKQKLLVLPFEGDNSNEINCLFCDGITEELIVMLSQIPHLSVYSRSTVFSFKHHNGESNKLILELGADLVLCGSVRIIDDNIKVISELINPKSGRILWSGSIKRKLSDVFELQEEITKNIVDALDIKLGEKKKARKQNYMSTHSIANSHFIRARQLYYNYNKQSVTDALKYYQQAIHIDPEFTLPYLGAAKSCLFIYQFVNHEDEYIEKAKKYSNKAIHIAPYLSVARTVKGMILTCEGKYDSAAEEFSKALQLDPQSFLAWYKFGKLCYLSEDYEQAGRLFEHAFRCREEDYQSLFYLGQIYEELRHYKLASVERNNAVNLVEKILKINPFERRALNLGAICQASLENMTTAEIWMSEALRQNNEDPLTLYAAASLYSKLNNKDKAISYLKKAIENGFSDIQLIRKDLNLKSIRNEIKFLFSVEHESFVV